MSVSFIARKCACGGKLEFNPEKKIWICKYCGTIVEREATFDKIHVDGIEGINDVVRQTLSDIANQKMDSALKNLDDCERKDHDHIGTLLAQISFNLTNISISKTQQDAISSIDKVKIYAKRLKEEYPVIAEDEINLYESFGSGSSDVIANLIVVFDTLADDNRRVYIFSKLRPEEVFSPYANKAMLKIAIKRNQLDLVDRILKNVEHIDKKCSLEIILDSYPDNEKKIQLINLLFNTVFAEQLQRNYFEKYFNESLDSVDTKCGVIALLNKTQIHCSADAIMKNISEQTLDYYSSRKFFDTVYGIKISDQETEALLLHCLTVCNKYEIQSAFFDTLIEKSVFVSLSGKTIITFLDSTKLPADQRVEIIANMFKLQIDNRAKDSVYNYYLNSNTDESDIRMKLIKYLLVADTPISANTVKTYIIYTKTDGDEKESNIHKIFETGINKLFLGDILSEYLLCSDDTKEQSERISRYLISLGFKMDSKILNQYLASDRSVDQKVAIVSQLINNGTMIRADTLDNYILSLKKTTDFSSDLFALLTKSNYVVGFQAYSKYVLYCYDKHKDKNHELIMNALNCDLSGQRVTISHNEYTINCNIAQAFCLKSTDTFECAFTILRQMINLKVKLNLEIQVDGIKCKFMKYIGEHKNDLSAVTLQLIAGDK